MGGAGALSEPDAGGLRGVRLGVVSVFAHPSPAGRQISENGCQRGAMLRTGAIFALASASVCPSWSEKEAAFAAYLMFLVTLYLFVVVIVFKSLFSLTAGSLERGKGSSNASTQEFPI